MFLILALVTLAVASTSCPKETQWRRGVCMGPQATMENSESVSFGPVDPKCCSCPRRARLRQDEQGCHYFTYILRRRVTVSDECCKLAHYEARDHRQRWRDRDDPAATAYHVVNGRGFFRGWSLPGSRRPTSNTNTGRGLLANEVCPTSRVNLREAPSTSGRVLEVLPAGQGVQATGGRQNGFTQVATRGGRQGWVSSQFLSACPRSQGPVPASNPVPAPSSPGLSNQVASGNGLCPMFYKIWEGYPPHSVETSDLLVRLGFCRAGEPNCWVTNSCAIRMTLGLNNAGLDPGRIGPTKWSSKGRRFLIRVEEGVRFVPAVFGPSYARGGQGVPTNQRDEQGNQIYGPPQSIVGKAGLIHFSNCGWSDATGHWDVWDGRSIRNHEYFAKCKNVQVFNLCNANPRPDWSDFRSHLRRTNALGA